MPRLIFSPSSRQDLIEIFDFIARDKPIAASNWIDLIEEKFLDGGLILISYQVAEVIKETADWIAAKRV